MQVVSVVNDLEVQVQQFYIIYDLVMLSILVLLLDMYWLAGDWNLLVPKEPAIKEL